MGIYGIPESFQDDPAEAPPTPDPEASPSPERHPRPDGSIIRRRDDAVLEFVRSRGGVSRTEVAEHMGLTLYEAYLSLSRVRHSGAIRTARRANAHVWISSEV